MTPRTLKSSISWTVPALVCIQDRHLKTTALSTSMLVKTLGLPLSRVQMQDPACDLRVPCRAFRPGPEAHALCPRLAGALMRLLLPGSCWELGIRKHTCVSCIPVLSTLVTLVADSSGTLH